MDQFKIFSINKINFEDQGKFLIYPFDLSVFPIYERNTFSKIQIFCFSIIIVIIELKDQLRISDESFVSRQRNHVYKPFKKTATTTATTSDETNTASYDESCENDEYYESEEAAATSTTNPTTTLTSSNAATDKNYNSFFMTQDDDVEEEMQKSRVQKVGQKTKKKEELGAGVGERLESYELLMNIENEDEIRVPKDVSGSVRALKQMLGNPLVFREPCREADRRTNIFGRGNRVGLKRNSLSSLMTSRFGFFFLNFSSNIKWLIGCQ
jgi:hypothetical protein